MSKTNLRVSDQRMLKIGFVSQDDADDVTPWSGTPFHVLRALRKQDVAVEVFSPLKQSFRYALAPIKIAARLAKQDVIFDHFHLALHSYARQLEQKMKQRPVDVLLSMGTQPWTLLESEIPIVFYTDAIFHMMPGYYGGMLDRLTSGAIRRGMWQEETALARCAIGAYASNWAVDGARKLAAADAGKFRMVPFGASMQEDHKEETVAQWAFERSSRMPSECQLLFIGVDWIRKGGDVAVETARLLNEMGVRTKLTIVGCMPDHEVPEYVELLGFISKRTIEGRKKLKELFSQATFFLLPTKAEAAGIVFCEASAYGVPALTYKTGGVGDYVLDGINGACLPTDSTAASFSTRIIEMMQDRDKYHTLCMGGFNEYKTRLNWDSCASTLIELCREAVLHRRHA